MLERGVLVSSFSKTHTLTGDRCGWVGFGDARFAAACGPGWTNSTASLPAEWQLRYMAYLRLFAERPEQDAGREDHRPKRSQLAGGSTV